MNIIPETVYVDQEFSSQLATAQLNFNQETITYAELARKMIEVAVECGALDQPKLDLTQSTTVADSCSVVVFKIGRRHYLYDQQIDELGRLQRWPLMARSGPISNPEPTDLPEMLIGTWKAKTSRNASSKVLAALSVYTFRENHRATIFDPMFEEEAECEVEVFSDNERLIVKFIPEVEGALCITSFTEGTMRLAFMDGTKVDLSDWVDFEKAD